MTSSDLDVDQKQEETSERPRTDKRRHHFVPRFYLKNFSIGGEGKTIGVFNLQSNHFIKSAKLKTQAYRRNFYAADGISEDALSQIESLAAPVITEIIRYDRLPTKSSAGHQYILMFTICQYSRTVYAAEEQNELIDKTLKGLYANDARFKPYLASVKFRLKDPVTAALAFSGRNLPLMLDLKYKLITNRSNVPFITSDNPAVFYNQFFEPIQMPGATTGLLWKGLEIFLPLSPAHCLIF